MAPLAPRLAVRALILHRDRLLIVNAYAGRRSDLWCAPGGGVMAGASLPANLIREVHEECGIRVTVGEAALVNEFHDPRSGFHQAEVFFRCTVADDALPEGWTDPERVVNRRRFVTRAELTALRHKPDSLGPVAWGAGLTYDPLEVIVR